MITFLEAPQRLSLLTVGENKNHKFTKFSSQVSIHDAKTCGSWNSLEHFHPQAFALWFPA